MPPVSFSITYDLDSPLPEPIQHSARANATFVVLCNNNDLGPAMTSMQQLEDRFNGRFGYPWVFLGEEPFTESFKLSVVVPCACPPGLTDSGTVVFRQ